MVDSFKRHDSVLFTGLKALGLASFQIMLRQARKGDPEIYFGGQKDIEILDPLFARDVQLDINWGHFQALLPELVSVGYGATWIILPVAVLVIESGGIADWSGISARRIDADTVPQTRSIASTTPVISPAAIESSAAVIGVTTIEPTGRRGVAMATVEVSSKVAARRRR